MGWIRLKGGFRIGLGLLEAFIELNDLFNKEDFGNLDGEKGLIDK